MLETIPIFWRIPFEKVAIFLSIHSDNPTISTTSSTLFFYLYVDTLLIEHNNLIFAAAKRHHKMRDFQLKSRNYLRVNLDYHSLIVLIYP